MHFFETKTGPPLRPPYLAACRFSVTVLPDNPLPAKIRSIARNHAPAAHDKALPRTGSFEPGTVTAAHESTSSEKKTSTRAPHGQGLPSKMRFGTQRRSRSSNHYGNCSADKQAIQCGVSIGIQDSIDQLLEKVETEVSAGYRRIKLKVKPGSDLSILERVRSRWPDILLSCDANSAYTLDQVEHLRKFDQFNLLMIEQPLWNDDIYYHARLQRELRTAICLDESIRHARDAAAASKPVRAAS